MTSAHGEEAFAGPAILFCPADRPDRYQKALDRADSIIIDLEDAVVEGSKDDAREALSTWLDERDDDPALLRRVIVRINATDSDHYASDVALLARTSVERVMVPKVSGSPELDRVSEDLPGVRLLALCETPEGVARSLEIASHDAVSALMWGAEDLIASLGGTSSRHADDRYRDVARFARSQVLISASAYGKIAIDSIYANFSDVAGLRAESEDTVASGFAAKACIHPSQCAVVREAYVPTGEQIESARELLKAVATEAGAFTFRGSMVDEPLIRHARRILKRAGI